MSNIVSLCRLSKRKRGYDGENGERALVVEEEKVKEPRRREAKKSTREKKN